MKKITKKAVKEKTAKEKAEQSQAARKKAEKEREERSKQKALQNQVTEESVEEVKTTPEVTYIHEEEMETSKKPTYVGQIGYYNNFYNFNIVGKLDKNGYTALRDYEIDELLRNESIKRNINLSYEFWNEKQSSFMRENLFQDQWLLFDFEIEDLQENYDSSGQRNPTAFKINFAEAYSSKVIRSLSNDGYYRLLSEEDLYDDIHTTKRIRINGDDICVNDKILVNFKDGFYAGPFEIKYSAVTDDFFFIAHDATAKGVISGYDNTNCVRTVIENEVDGWNGASLYVYSIVDESKVIKRDVISDKELIESVIELMKDSSEDKSTESLLKKYTESALLAGNLSAEVKQSRIQRVKSIIETGNISEEIKDSFSELIRSFLHVNKETRAIDAYASIWVDRSEAFQNARQVESDERLEIAKQQIDSLKQELQKANDEIAELEKNNIHNASDQYQESLVKFNLVDDIKALEQKKKGLENDVSYFERHNDDLKNETRKLESGVVDIARRYTEEVDRIVFDGFVSSKMLESAAEWRVSNEEQSFYEVMKRVNAIESEPLSANDVIEYFVEAIQIVRPQYSRNTIINLLICTTQGFLTVFSGKPGCGKTSICNILAKVMGLREFDSYIEDKGELNNVNRYVPVSVERGWTSKRDFIGYYNPLTKIFEESNRDVYNGIRLLNLEHKNNCSKYPFYVLLDEANLSPMEYYWADFMNVCDDIEDNNTINLGNNNIYSVPETLHFLATINNDHTTETLSPRLVDRAWIITLPKVQASHTSMSDLNDVVKLVSWEELNKAFVAVSEVNQSLDIDAQKIYDDIKKHVGLVDINISPRADSAIRNYCYVASHIMEPDDFGNDPSIVALDFAVSQKILPKIEGNGEEFGQWLMDFKEILSSNMMMNSVGILEDIINRGNKSMNYYSFFRENLW
ncbi:MAG: hypothetical protein HUJ71_10680 [Pseudobutyrivibrio sp.]|nr:hypothetical protein [Pseudobutyrivibrio sp.]